MHLDTCSGKSDFLFFYGRWFSSANEESSEIKWNNNDLKFSEGKIRNQRSNMYTSVRKQCNIYILQVSNLSSKRLSRTLRLVFRIMLLCLALSQWEAVFENLAKYWKNYVFEIKFSVENHDTLEWSNRFKHIIFDYRCWHI